MIRLSVYKSGTRLAFVPARGQHWRKVQREFFELREERDDLVLLPPHRRTILVYRHDPFPTRFNADRLVEPLIVDMPWIVMGRPERRGAYSPRVQLVLAFDEDPRGGHLVQPANTAAHGAEHYYTCLGYERGADFFNTAFSVNCLHTSIRKVGAVFQARDDLLVTVREC